MCSFVTIATVAWTDLTIELCQLSEDLRPLSPAEELSLAHCELKDLSNVCEMLETPGLALTSLDLSANSFGDDEGGGALTVWRLWRLWRKDGEELRSPKIKYYDYSLLALKN